MVTTGQYSDYSIHSLWTDREKAEKLVEILNRERYAYADINEMELDRPAKEMAGFKVLIDLTTGEQVADEYISMNQPCVIDADGPRVFPWNCARRENLKKIDGEWKTLRYNHIGWEDKKNIVPCQLVGTGPTVEHALKAVRDLRTQVLAELEGIA